MKIENDISLFGEMKTTEDIYEECSIESLLWDSIEG